MDIMAEEVKETREEQRRNHILYKNIEDTFQGFFGSKVKLDAGKRRGKNIHQMMI